jgi:hypothetical protein
MLPRIVLSHATRSADDVTLATLGRDGLDDDENADFSAHFQPSPPPAAATP